MALFNRSASVILQTENEQTEIKNVRIVFDCTKSSDSTKNGATIQVYNLSQKTRAKFDVKDAKIILNAGYVDSGGEEILFSGTITQSTHKLELPEIITYFEVSDGFKALRDARISESLKSGTTLKQVIKLLTDATGLPIKELSDKIPDEQFSQGVSLIGSVYDQIVSIADKYGLEFSVINEEIQVVKKHDVNNDTAIVLHSGTGLIKKPERIIKDSSKLTYSDVKKLKVESLLIPQLNPAGTVEIISDEVNGLFRIDSVQHTGDTHGQNWTSVCEVRAI